MKRRLQFSSAPCRTTLPAALLALGSTLAVARARAESREAPATVPADRHANVADGVYHRLDGDLELGAAIGGVFSAHRPRGSLSVSAHYFAMAGAYLGYRPRVLEGGAASELTTGVDFRPAFIPRFALNTEHGPSLLDLSIDSLSLNFGVFLMRPAGGAFGEARGFECGLGLGVPLLGRADGPWLETRGLLRFPDQAGSEQAWLVALGFHAFALTPLVSD